MKILVIIMVLILLFKVDIRSQTYFEIESRYGYDFGVYTKQLLELKKYHEDDIQKIFNYIVKESEIEFGYMLGGCQQRAEIMHYILSKKNIEHAKIWLFAPVKLKEGMTTYIEIKDNNNFTKDGIIKWDYHVAPCLLVSSSFGTIDTLIIDPSLNTERPLRLREWFSIMGNYKYCEYTFLNAQYYFFNTLENGKSPVVNGYFYKYEPIRGSVTMYDNATVERELAVSDVAIFIKRKIDREYSRDNKSIITLTSEISNMIGLFAAQQTCHNLQDVTIRELWDNHEELLEESFIFYNNRVSYWLHFMKQ